MDGARRAALRRVGAAATLRVEVDGVPIDAGVLLAADGGDDALSRRTFHCFPGGRLLSAAQLSLARSALVRDAERRCGERRSVQAHLEARLGRPLTARLVAWSLAPPLRVETRSEAVTRDGCLPSIWHGGPWRREDSRDSPSKPVEA